MSLTILEYIMSNSSEANGSNINMLESNFSIMSISPMYRGENRPPALSSSSISSIEEFSSKSNNHHVNNNNYLSHPNAAPSSPISNASVRSQFQSAPGSGFNSPVITPSVGTGLRLEAGNSNNYQGSTANNMLLGSRKYSNLDSAFYTRTVKSLPTFKEHTEEHDQPSFSHGESIFSSFDDDGLHSFKDYSKALNFRRSTSDLLDNSSSAFSCWPAVSNAASSHSLNNMGSVDENEQYTGNRSRTLSAASSFGYPKASSGSFSNIPEYQEDLHVSSYLQQQGGNENYSFDGLSAASESPLQTQVRYFSFDGSRQNHRQRVMSADALHMSSFCKGGGMIASSQQFHSRGYSNQYLASSNRPRSFSSGHTAPNFSSGFSYPSTASTSTGYTNESNGVLAQQQQAPGMKMPPYPQPQDSNHLLGRSFEREHHYPAQDPRYLVPQERLFHVQQARANQIMPIMVYTVKFKRSQKNFVLGSQMIGDIKIGSYVKVEADRGEDLGIVLSRIPIEKFNAAAAARQGAQNLDAGDVQFKKITRLATDQEISLLSLKEEEEAELLKICRSKTSQRGLPMNVVDAEYQFDRHKLTFFFEASCRVDFRELVRDLFSIYKTRIWMQQIDKAPNNPVLSSSISSKPSRGSFEAQNTTMASSLHSIGTSLPTATSASFDYQWG